MSKLKKIIIILFLLLLNNFCYSQEDNEVYIIFKTNESNCKENKDYYFKGKFYICGESFMIRENTCLKTIEKQLSKELNILSISNFLEKCKEKGMKYVFNPNELYKKIYILEEFSNEKYLVFEVEWKASYIN